METLRTVFILGMIIRPLQIIVMLYLALIQGHELRVVTPYQAIKRLLLVLFLANAFAYSFSLFIDLVGIFHWFPSKGLLFLSLYLIINILSATLTTTLLLVIYKLRITG